MSLQADRGAQASFVLVEGRGAKFGAAGFPELMVPFRVVICDLKHSQNLESERVQYKTEVSCTMKE